MNREVLSRYTNPSVQKHLTMLDTNSPEYLALDANQKLAVMHLTRAADWINKAYLRMENARATQFREYLEQGIRDQDPDSQKMLDFYMDMRALVFIDLNGEEVKLYSQAKDTGWQNFYPEDLTHEEFHQILDKMLTAGKVTEVAKIVSNRTMVVRDGEDLRAIDYVEYFPEFQECAKELRKAISFSQDAQLNEFLQYQAKALCTVDEELDCTADTLWAKLVNSTLDFTLTRESYDDTMTESLFGNTRLMTRLQEHNIQPHPKDSLGARVGIRNAKGTEFLLSVSSIADVISANMPNSDKHGVSKQDNDSVLDLDIVCLSGCECVAGRCTIAQVLPNDDKLAVIRGGARKKVYNRQTRFSPAPDYIQYLLAPEVSPYFDLSANHYSVICHETTHTFGPQKALLGKYTSILEEEKADLGALAFLYEMQKADIFAPATVRRMITTELATNFQKTQPKLSQAHAVERVMILNKMFMDKAMWIGNDNLIHIDFPQVVSSSYQLLTEVVDIQSSGSVERAEEHINKYFMWGEEMQKVADIIRKHSPYIIRILKEPLKDYLLSTQAEIELNSEYNN